MPVLHRVLHGLTTTRGVERRRSDEDLGGGDGLRQLREGQAASARPSRRDGASGGAAAAGGEHGGDGETDEERRAPLVEPLLRGAAEQPVVVIVLVDVPPVAGSVALTSVQVSPSQVVVGRRVARCRRALGSRPAREPRSRPAQRPSCPRR